MSFVKNIAVGAATFGTAVCLALLLAIPVVAQIGPQPSPVTTVAPSPKLSVSKPNEVSLGDWLEITLSVKNEGGTAGLGIVRIIFFADEVDHNVQFPDYNFNNQATAAVIPDVPEGRAGLLVAGQKDSWQWGQGESISMKVRVKPLKVGKLRFFSSAEAGTFVPGAGFGPPYSDPAGNSIGREDYVTVAPHPQETTPPSQTQPVQTTPVPDGDYFGLFQNSRNGMEYQIGPFSTSQEAGRAVSDYQGQQKVLDPNLIRFYMVNSGVGIGSRNLPSPPGLSTLTPPPPPPQNPIITVTPVQPVSPPPTPVPAPVPTPIPTPLPSPPAPQPTPAPSPTAPPPSVSISTNIPLGPQIVSSISPTITITWNSQHATVCKLNDVQVSLSDSITETLTAPKSYFISCTGSGGGTASDKVDVLFESPNGREPEFSQAVGRIVSHAPAQGPTEQKVGAAYNLSLTGAAASVVSQLYYGASGDQNFSPATLAIGAVSSIPGAPTGKAVGKTVIGATGKIGEDALKVLGGKSQKFFNTPLGGRRVDQFTIGNTANESKVGYQSLTAATKIQIAKDTYLIKQGTFADDVWHFFQSPITGLIGASKPLLQALEDAGISIFVHK